MKTLTQLLTLPHSPHATALLAAVAVLGSLVASTGCTRTVGDALRPDDHTAASSMGAELVCSDTPTRIKPLIVDWSPDERVDLEAALGQDGVVVVKYDCPTMEILPGCHVDGSYSYAGVSRKEQVIQMENMDDIHANIPVSSAKVSAEIQSGRAINLATVLVGRRSTTVSHLTEGGLTGQCEGATHFVRSASLGAFSMATGSVGKAAIVAEMFGYGGGASSDSERSDLNMDGSLESCRTSDPGSDDPPSECQAPIRIELMPIVAGEAGEGAAEALAASKKSDFENPCLPGYVFANDMCKRPSADLAYLCDPEDKDECREQCGKGDAESCLNLGRLVSRDQAQVPFKKACDADIPEACTALGEIVWYDVDPDEDSNWRQAVDVAYGLLNKGCMGGDGYGCELAADISTDDDQTYYDLSDSLTLYTRACDLGSGYGCYAASKQLFEGEGAAKDIERGFDLLLRSCEGGSADQCGDIGAVFEKGRYGVPQDSEVAAKWYGIACQGDIAFCETAGDLSLEVGSDEHAALFFAMDCENYTDGEGCGKLGEMLIAGRGIDTDEELGMRLLNASCDGGYGRFCDMLGRPTPE